MADECRQQNFLAKVRVNGVWFSKEADINKGEDD